MGVHVGLFKHIGIVLRVQILPEMNDLGPRVLKLKTVGTYNQIQCSPEILKAPFFLGTSPVVGKVD